MRITIFAAGSQGDIQPCILLGRSLQSVGYSPLLAAPENFASLARSQELQIHPLRGDVRQIMEGQTGARFMESGGSNPIRSVRAMRTMLGPVALQMAEDAFEATQEAKALISLGVFALLAKTIAEVRGIPLILVEPTPLLPTRAYPAPGWPLQVNLGAIHNFLSGHLMLRVIWEWYRPFVNDFRRRFGLLAFAAGDFHRVLASTPLLGAYSPSVIPHPADAPPTAHTTGYWFQDARSDWRPARELEAFLGAGPPPVYVGFGSMSGQDPERLAKVVLQALSIAGLRGLLLTGWGGLRATSLPDTVFAIDSAPHSWLFPRMAAIVHHGGAGTTAEGLRAGVPSTIVPFIVDQPWWGRRVRALGAGPNPIPRKNLTADNLANAMRESFANPRMKQRAEYLGQTIRSEDGLGSAVRLVRQYLGA
jgi:sterol 3beta-glucosyltransferase